ncbi:histidine phosphatase family protein [Sorangium sp. So ce1128]
MSRMLIVRHGQASAGSENYDVLSSVGVMQSRRLGAWLVQRSIHLDAIWCGPLQRQRDTARHLVAAAAEAGHRFPEPIVMDEFSELPAIEIVRHALTRLREEAAARPELEGAGGRDGAAPRQDEIAPMAELALVQWANGRLDAGDLESFTAFEARVRRGLDRVKRAANEGQRVAVVSSAGPVAVAMRLALNLDSTLTIRLGGVVSNSSITELCFRSEHPKLIAFNVVSHLEHHEITQL